MKKKNLEWLGIVAGALLIAVGLYFFWAPCDLAAGGVSGLSIVVKALLPNIPIGGIIFVLDFIMFALGFLTLGKSFGGKSLICSLSVSMIMTLLELMFPLSSAMSQDVILMLIFGSFFIALGQAIVFNLEASSGGTDIIAKMITQYIPIPIGIALMFTDMIVVILAAFIFGIEKGLYALLGVFLTTQLIDYMISGINISRYVMIIPSDKEYIEPIKTRILDRLQRGATLYEAQGAYSSTKKMVITTVVGRREFVGLKRYILEIDPQAFVTVSNLHEVVGQGFVK